MSKKSDTKKTEALQALGKTVEAYHDAEKLFSTLMENAARLSGQTVNIKFNSTSHSTNFTSGKSMGKWRYEAIDAPNETTNAFTVQVCMEMPKEHMSEVLRNAVKNILKGKIENGIVKAAGGRVPKKQVENWTALNATGKINGSAYVPLVRSQETIDAIEASNAKRAATKAANAEKASQEPPKSTEPRKPSEPKKQTMVLGFMEVDGVQHPITMPGILADKVSKGMTVKVIVDKESMEAYRLANNGKPTINKQKAIDHKVKSQSNGSALDSINQAAKEAV